MKKIALMLCLLASIVCDLQGQNQNLNLSKYWTYRQRLRDKFIYINPNIQEPGGNIPASAINRTTGVIDWGDGNMNFSHYLSMLSTELWLLKNNNQDYQKTLAELYYAMASLERLDLYSEMDIACGDQPNCLPTVYTSDLNGFHMRDDVTPNFWQQRKSHFDVPNFNSVYVSTTYPREAISQDNIYHNLEGLGLVSKLVGTENVEEIPITIDYLVIANPIITNYLISKEILSSDHKTVNFSLWAKDKVKRYLNLVQSDPTTYTIDFAGLGTKSTTNNWTLKNPISHDDVEQGSGNLEDDGCNMGLFYNVGLVNAAKAITGEPEGALRQHSAFIVSNGDSRWIYNQLFDVGPLENYTITLVSWPWPFDEVWDDIEVKINFDDYKVRTLGAVGNAAGNETFGKLRSHRDNSASLDYEHLPLINVVINDPTNYELHAGNSIYETDRALLENLLNAAPTNGPRSNPPPLTNTLWSIDSRLIWPERLGTKLTQNIEYSGLDYMMLHNLYYIGLQRADLVNLVINNDPAKAFYRQGPFHWANTIEMSNTFAADASVSYIANKSIVLKPGALMPSGSDIRIRTSPTDSYDATLYADPNGGRMSTHKPTTPPAITHDYSDAIFVNGNRPVTASKPVKVVKKEKETSPNLAFPVPAAGRITVNGSVEPYDIEITDQNGQIVLKSEQLSGKSVVDIQGIKPGIYILKVKETSGLRIQKIIIRENN